MLNDGSAAAVAERCVLRDACAAHAHAQIHELAPLEERALVDQVSDRDRAVGCFSALRAHRARTTLCAQCKVCAVLCRRLTAAQGCCAVWAVRTRLPTPLLLSPPVGSRHGRGLADFLARQRSKTSSWTSISVRRARSVPPGLGNVDRHPREMLRATFMRRSGARLACSTERLAHVHRRL